jgi:hypothetical protein
MLSFHVFYTAVAAERQNGPAGDTESGLVCTARACANAPAKKLRYGGRLTTQSLTARVCCDRHSVGQRVGGKDVQPQQFDFQTPSADSLY